MLLRKINAGISLLCVFMLLFHAVFNAVWMLSGCTIPQIANKMPRVLTVVMFAHAIISIVLAILGHKGAEKRKFPSYSKMNKATNIQRIGGILLLPFTALHILGAIGVMQPPQVIHAILPPLFFAIALIHAVISTSKAFVTLGIGNSTFVKVTDVAIKVICGVTLIADLIGFYLYVC